MLTALPAECIDALRRLDSCTAANAIEVFKVRLRNEGFTNAGIRCLFPDLPPLVGHVVRLLKNRSYKVNNPSKNFVACGCALLIGVVLLASSCSRAGGAVKADQAGQKNQLMTDKPLTVAVAQAVREDLSQRLSLAAEFRPMQEVELHAKVAGYLKDIRVDVGDRVRQGQVVATLEIPEFQSDLTQAAAARKRSEGDVVRARSEVQRAQSVYDAARLTYERLAGVVKARPNLLAQQEVDDAQAKMLVAAAQLDTAKAALGVAEEQVRVQEAGEARVKTIAEYTTITTPFAGLITKRFADKGAMIQAGTASQTQAMPVVRLSQVDHLRLVLPVPESAVPHVQAGRTVAVKVPALNQTFAGRVARFTGKVDSATRTMETEVDVPNPRLLLKPGMYASADLELDRRPSALTVPVQAVVRKEGKTTVMLVNAQRKLEVREVVTGLETPQSVEITSGLSEGDLVVIGNQSQLKPGLAVEPKVTTLGAAKTKGGR
jgi:RND family efflux transporter MFP subunit